MLRFGPDTGPLAIAALPLFEEANRSRRFVVTILHALAGRGVGSILPDFSGAGESLVATEHATLASMRDGYEALVAHVGRGRPLHAIGIRSGALLDGNATLAGRWHLSPVTGEAVLRDLERVRLASRSPEPGVYAGNRLSQDMMTDLATARPGTAPPLRVVRLDTDPRPADRKLPGKPLWRAAEPTDDPSLAAALAEDIARWIATCAG